MQKTLLILTCAMLALTGCATVHVSVNSMKDEQDITRDVPIVFPKRGTDIEIEKMRRQCAKGAQAAEIKVMDKCSGKCYFATVDGTTGGTTQSINSAHNSYTGQTQVYSSGETQRKVKIAIYSDLELKTLIYQAVLDSSGSNNNVLSVAEEMCEAGFKAYPNEYSAKKYKIRAR